jgi:L-alanine-DL-glutamate epimerase-like enolase superfamily enzyme
MSHEALIDRNPAAWCAVETACLDLLGRVAGCPIESVLSLPALAGSFRYSAVLGTDNPKTFQKQLSQYLTLGFTDFKVKVTGNVPVDRHKIDRLKVAPQAGLRIRLDANNLWKTPREASDYVTHLDYPFWAIEEPLQVGDYDGCRALSRELGLPIILDESFLRIEQFASIQDTPSCWIINIRVSKMGGLLRSLAVAERAKAVGMPIIVGAQVGETSILTRVALTVANAYRDNVLAQEGAFGTYLLERDICQPTLMFGKEGLLATDSFRSEPGLGLTMIS